MIKPRVWLLSGILIFGLFSCFKNNVSPEINIEKSVSTENAIELIDNYLDSLSNIKKFNGAVLIAKNGKPLLMTAKGYTDHTNSSELTQNSSFRLASLSKQFTATGIMILKEQSKLDYDDMVSKYIQDFPYEDVSIRNLLTHTSGIPDDYIKLATKFAKFIGPELSIEEAINLIVENKPNQDSGTNEEFSYSNTGYVLLARIIELVSEKSFEEFMDQELFTPLGMTTCRVWNLLSEEKTFEHKTSSFKYQASKAIELRPNFIDGVAGDGAVFCSISDFLIWDEFWRGNELISNTSLNEAIKPHILINGDKSDYGFGWSLKHNKMQHSGSWLGARTMISRNLDNNIMLVILDNSQNKHIGIISKTLSTFVDALEK